jgi:hypothetical protein
MSVANTPVISSERSAESANANSLAMVAIRVHCSEQPARTWATSKTSLAVCASEPSSSSRLKGLRDFRIESNLNKGKDGYTYRSASTAERLACRRRRRDFTQSARPGTTWLSLLSVSMW